MYRGGDMKRLIAVLIALAATPLLAAHSDVTGKWTTSKGSEVSVQMQLTSSGGMLTGNVRLGSGQPVDIFDGTIVGDKIRFKAMVPDGDAQYAMMFSGRRSGDRIDFKCDVDITVPGEKTEFGPACVAKISVRRVAH
jgi:hypothetical protein